ncbi:FAD-binding oxidoreductase [Haloarculaceae archaeon H-GB11]|nr:FAD-binding oxidoreductase [Haloarculaceae archaeon H-GB11]
MSPSPDAPDSTDVVVVGGGIMGTSTAYFLSVETDRRVTLVEKDSVAAGSSGDSSAIIRHHYGGNRDLDPHVYAKMAWWSHQFYRSFTEETGEEITHEDAPLVRFGTEGTGLGDAVERGYEVLKELDVPASRYDGAELQRRYPMYAHVGEYDFAVSDDRAGYSDGTDVANGFARAARANGATVVTGVGVTGIREADGSVIGVDTDAGEIDCEDVVVAAGPWTERLAADVGVDLPLRTTRENVFILESESFREQYGDETPMVSLPGDKWYTRPAVGEKFLVATSVHTEDADPDAYEQEPDEPELLELVDWIDENMPVLDDADIVGKYSGIYTNTPDLGFVLDQIGPDGCFVACGFSGHGFKHAPAVGRIMSDLVTAGTTAFVDVDFFGADRFDSGDDGSRESATTADS